MNIFGHEISYDKDWGYFYTNEDGEMIFIDENQVLVHSQIDKCFLGNLMDLNDLKKRMDSERFDGLFFPILYSYIFHSDTYLSINELRKTCTKIRKEYKKSGPHLYADYVKLCETLGGIGGEISGKSRYLRFFLISCLTQYLLFDLDFSFVENIPRVEIQDFQYSVFGQSIKNDFACGIWRGRASKKKIYFDSSVISESKIKNVRHRFDKLLPKFMISKKSWKKSKK